VTASPHRSPARPNNARMLRSRHVRHAPTNAANCSNDTVGGRPRFASRSRWRGRSCSIICCPSTTPAGSLNPRSTENSARSTSPSKIPRATASRYSSRTEPKM